MHGAGVNITKLITGFLVLSLVLGSVMLAVSSRSLAKPGAPLLEDTRNTNRTPEAAFVEPVRDLSSSGLAFYGPNYTDAVAQNITARLLELEEARAASGLAARGSMSVGEADTLLDQFLEEGLVPQEFPVEALAPLAIVPEERIIHNYTNDDIASYQATMTKLSERYLFASSLAGLERVSPNVSAADGVADTLDLLIRDAENMNIPAPLVGYHTSFLRIFSSNRALSEIAASDDPMRAILVRNAEAPRFYQALLQFQAEESRTREIFARAESERSFGVVPFLLFQPRAAHAIFDGGGSWAVVGRMIWEWIETLIVEHLKDRLVKKLADQAADWARGDGKPQFITDWKGFLRESANEAVGLALEGVLPNLCRSFGPLVNIAMLPLPDPTVDPVRCTLDDIIDNLSDLRGDLSRYSEDFRQGGWYVFAASAHQRNNAFGVLESISQIAKNKEEDSKKAAEAEGQGNEGFLSTRLCNSSYTVRPGVPQPASIVKNEPGYVPGSCIRSGASKCREWKICNEGGWYNTSPGKFIGDAVSKNISSGPLERIVNAFDLPSVAAVVVDSLLARTIKAGSSGLLGSGASGNTNDAQSSNSCAFLRGQALLDCIGYVASIGGEVTPPGGGTPGGGSPPSFNACPSNPPPGQPICSENRFAGPENYDAFLACLEACSAP